METVFALFPVVALIWSMTKARPLTAHVALPLAALCAVLIQWGYFQADALTLSANIIAGGLAVLTPVSIIAGAILLNRVLVISGAEQTLRQWLAGISPNPVAQLMVIGWAFAFMLEGASGFGTPAAIAAPILVGLGFPALPVALLTLVMNSVPVSFGAVGTPAWFGFAGLALTAPLRLEVAQWTALIHLCASFVIPVIALRWLVSWREIWQNSGFILISIVSCTAPFFLIAQINDEFPLILTTGRVRDQWHTMTKTGKVARLKTHYPKPVLEINPVDAYLSKIKDGNITEIKSSNGTVRVRAKVTGEIKKGVVFLPMHWGKILQSNLNRANNLTNTHVDPVSKEPDFKFTTVSVSKYKKPKEKIIIAGAGAAAFRFLQNYRDYNEVDEIHVFSKESNLFYNRVLLPEYITEELSWEQLLKIKNAELSNFAERPFTPKNVNDDISNSYCY